jgi:hypothetical protein
MHIQRELPNCAMPLEAARFVPCRKNVYGDATLVARRALAYAGLMRYETFFCVLGLCACSSSAPTPTFTQIYTNTISNKCAPCHTTATGDGVNFGKLDMTSQSAAYMNLVNTAAAGVQCGGKGTRVVPGNADGSIMYLKISLDDPSPCGNKMPDNLPPLSSDEVTGIESWINAGAPNN